MWPSLRTGGGAVWGSASICQLLTSLASATPNRWRDDDDYPRVCKVPGLQGYSLVSFPATSLLGGMNTCTRTDGISTVVCTYTLACTASQERSQHHAVPDGSAVLPTRDQYYYSVAARTKPVILLRGSSPICPIEAPCCRYTMHHDSGTYAARSTSPFHLTGACMQPTDSP